MWAAWVDVGVLKQRKRKVVGRRKINIWKERSSVADPYSLNPDPDPVKNLNPDPSYFVTTF